MLVKKTVICLIYFDRTSVIIVLFQSLHHLLNKRMPMTRLPVYYFWTYLGLSYVNPEEVIKLQVTRTSWRWWMWQECSLRGSQPAWIAFNEDLLSKKVALHEVLFSTRCHPRAVLHNYTSTSCHPWAVLHKQSSVKCPPRAVLHEQPLRAVLDEKSSMSSPPQAILHKVFSTRCRVHEGLYTKLPWRQF